MSFIGNIAAAQTAKELGKYNEKVTRAEANYLSQKADVQGKIYQKIERPRLIDNQEFEFSNFFVQALSSGAEMRAGTTPFFVKLKNKQNQMFELALADYNQEVSENDIRNQSLLLKSRAEGERFKGDLTAYSEYAKATGSLLTMGYQSQQAGRLVIS